MSLFVSNSLPTISLSISQPGIISFQDYLKLIAGDKKIGQPMGVYIWGFKFPENKEINGGNFMPFYVGQAGGKGKGSIYERLKCHFEFNENYHVIKEEWLPFYNCFWLTDVEINKLNEAELHIYRRNYFDYLNKREIKELKSVNSKNKFEFKALNILKGKSGLKQTCSQIQSSINYYKLHFHLCWIEIPAEKNNLHRKKILDLEKYINNNIVGLQEKRLYGQKLDSKKIQFSFKINDSCIESNDRFLI